jgi:hypothetical protein
MEKITGKYWGKKAAKERITGNNWDKAAAKETISAYY